MASRRSAAALVPPGVEYALSDRGRELLVPLAGLADWVVRGQAA